MKRVLIILMILGLTVSATSCGTASTKLYFDSIESYRDIPGVTREEISAIEALKATGKSFSYGNLIATEAFILPDGSYAGFTTKLCKLLSELFGIEFVQEFYEWDDLIGRLDRKLIDFTGELAQTPERMRLYYMTHSIAERSLRIFTRVDSDEILLETDIGGLRIGFLNGAVSADYIKKVYPFSFETVGADNLETAAELMKSGAIDALICDATVDPFFEDYDFIRSKEFFSLVHTPVSLTTANPELEPVISVVNKYMVAGGIDKFYELYREGDNEYARYKLNRSFTVEERAYLDDLAARGAKVSIALEHENYPVSFYNEADKEFQGFALDVLEEISALTGISFEAVPTKDITWAEILEDLRTGKISMVTQVLYSDTRKNDFIWSRVPYARSYYALLSKSDYPDLEIYRVIRAKVGTINKTAFEDIYHESFPDSYNTISYNSMDEGLDALEKGRIDLLMGSEYIFLTQANYREKPGYKVNIRFSAPMDSLFGFSKNEEILCSIIDKAQAYVKTDSIVNGWTSRIFDYSTNFLKEITYYLVFFVGVLLFVLGIVIFLLLKNKRLSKELEKLARTDSLTEIYNKRYFMELALMEMEKSSRLNRNSFVIIFDLDHFKKINDSHGHSAGDEALKSVAARVKGTVRPYDLFARYGGEEFILLVTDIDKEAAQELTERIRRNVSKAPVEFEGMRIPVSASFGIAFAAPVNTLDAAIKLADKALYRAKDEGRDRVVFWEG